MTNSLYRDNTPSFPPMDPKPPYIRRKPREPEPPKEPKVRKERKPKTHTATGGSLTREDCQLYMDAIAAGMDVESAADLTNWSYKTYHAALDTGHKILMRREAGEDVSDEDLDSMQVWFVLKWRRCKAGMVQPTISALKAKAESGDVPAIKFFLGVHYPKIWREAKQEIEQTTTHKFASIEEAEAEARKGLEELGLAPSGEVIDITQREETDE